MRKEGETGGGEFKKMKVDGEEGRKKEDREGGRRCIYRERNREKGEKGNKGWVELAERERGERRV